MFDAILSFLGGRITSVLLAVVIALLGLCGYMSLEKWSLEKDVQTLTGRLERCQGTVEQFQNVRTELESQIEVLYEQCKGLKDHEQNKPKGPDPATSINDLLRELLQLLPPSKGSGPTGNGSDQISGPRARSTKD